MTSKIREEYERETGRRITPKMQHPSWRDYVAWLERRAEKWEEMAGRLAEMCGYLADLGCNGGTATLTCLEADLDELCYACQAKATLAEHEAAKGESHE